MKSCFNEKNSTHCIIEIQSFVVAARPSLVGENDGVRPLAVTGENRDGMPMMLQELTHQVLTFNCFKNVISFIYLPRDLFQ